MLNYDNDIVFKALMLKGDKGDQGTSIVSIEKTSTVGLVDTYTITLNDGTEYEFTVTNGTNSYYDSELSDESENAVQNKVIKGVIDTINATLVSIQEYDTELSATSENAVQNKVIKGVIDTINSALETIQQYDSALSASSENAVQNKVVKAAIDAKADSSALADYYNKTEIDSAFNNLGASNIPYNNTSSGLAATDTQAAIDEVAADVPTVDSSLNTSSTNAIQNGAVATALNSKLESSNKVTASSGAFPTMIQENQVWLIAVNRISTNSCCVVIASRFNDTIYVKEIVKDTGWTYATNSIGTIAFQYSSSTTGVYGGAYKLN